MYSRLLKSCSLLVTLYTHCTCTCTLNTVQGLSEGFYLVGSGSTGVATSLAILGIYFVVLTSFDKWNHLYRPFQILLILTVLLFVLTVMLFVLGFYCLFKLTTQCFFYRAQS